MKLGNQPYSTSPPSPEVNGSTDIKKGINEILQQHSAHSVNVISKFRKQNDSLSYGDGHLVIIPWVTTCRWGTGDVVRNSCLNMTFICVFLLCHETKTTDSRF